MKAALGQRGHISWVARDKVNGRILLVDVLRYYKESFSD